MSLGGYRCDLAVELVLGKGRLHERAILGVVFQVKHADDVPVGFRGSPRFSRAERAHEPASCRRYRGGGSLRSTQNSPILSPRAAPAWRSRSFTNPVKCRTGARRSQRDLKHRRIQTPRDEGLRPAFRTDTLEADPHRYPKAPEARPWSRHPLRWPESTSLDTGRARTGPGPAWSRSDGGHESASCRS